MQGLTLPQIKEFYNRNETDDLEKLSYEMFTLGNCVNDSLVGVKNILMNNEYISGAMDITDLRKLYKAKEAIIIAGGWSIDENIEEIKRLSKNRLVISCDTGLRILNQHGISPDFVTTLERVEECARLLKFENEKGNETVFVSSMVVDSLVMEEMIKKKHYAFCRFKNNSVFDLSYKFGELEQCNSSATMALSLADFLGVETVYLFGQDLCLSDNDKTHSQGAEYGNEQPNCYKNLSLCLCNDGNYRKTNSIWKAFAFDIERIRTNADSLKKIYNTNEKAMHLPGVSVIDAKTIKLIANGKPIVKPEHLNSVKLLRRKPNYTATINGLEYWIKKIDYTVVFTPGDVDEWNKYIKGSEWLKNLLQGLSLATYLIYDDREEYFYKMFNAVVSILRVVKGVFELNRVGIQNFDMGENHD